MNPFKKLYCRIFQTAFRIALPVLPYREPKILDQMQDLGPLFRKKKLKTVLLVTDPFLRRSGSTFSLEAHLAASDIKCVVYDKTQPNPTVQNIEEAFALYQKEHCEALIAFGGGSSMDCAKAVGARAAYPKRSLEQLKGLLRVLRRIPLLVAVPTTAGTGSEVTLAAVITDSVQKHKYTMMDFTLIPRYAVLDPAVTYSLPPSLTATTGMDALTHAVEAYIGRSTTKETRRLALEATHLIFHNIEQAYKNGGDRKARTNMLHAAYKAGIAFSKSYVGYVHAVAHSLGGQYNTPHGLANSVLLPVVLEEYGSCIYRKLHVLGVAAGVCTKEESHEEAAKKFIKAIYDLNARIGIPTKLFEIREADIFQMSVHADQEANPLYPVPKLMNAKELEKLYRLVSDGE